MLNGCVETCASRSGPALLSVPQEQASSTEFGLANMVYLFLGLRTPNHLISPAELVSHYAPVTLPCWRKRLTLFEIVEPSTIKEASKTEKVRKNFCP
jgi:hypothetical protein